MPSIGWRHGIITPDGQFDSKLRAICGWFDTKYQSNKAFCISEHPPEGYKEYHVHVIWFETSNSTGLSAFIRNELGLGFRTKRLFCYYHTNAYLHQIGRKVAKVIYTLY